MVQNEMQETPLIGGTQSSESKRNPRFMKEISERFYATGYDFNHK